MLFLNFAHPLAADQYAALRTLVGAPIEQTIDIQTQFDPAASFVEQANRLVQAVDLTPTEWQTTPILVNLPSLSVIAALVLANLHGRCGYFPAVLRMRPVADSTPPRFEVAEILNLQAMRDSSRSSR